MLFHVSFEVNPPMVTDRCTWVFQLSALPKVCSAVKTHGNTSRSLASSNTTSAAILCRSLSSLRLSWKIDQRVSGIVKVICWCGVSGMISTSRAIQWSVALLPQVGHVRQLQLWHTVLWWGQNSFSQQYFLWPRSLVQQLKTLIIESLTQVRIVSLCFS